MAGCHHCICQLKSGICRLDLEIGKLVDEMLVIVQTALQVDLRFLVNSQFSTHSAVCGYDRRQFFFVAVSLLPVLLPYKTALKYSCILTSSLIFSRPRVSWCATITARSSKRTSLSEVSIALFDVFSLNSKSQASPYK